ncbi:hypothetical protein IE53DRAFT_308273 [Violaceomyces palustris]|uniref:Uncharacterized protein n=1 Tax=Violaceomyces palustris TaxID=1673888 RepID=A0ACD0P8W0_9BASI|nr:hypothetical protein IE53DRAFT_308273 [Violaceomyces palustris]
MPGSRTLSIVAPAGFSNSTCGYCTSPGSGKRSKAKSSASYGFWAYQLTPQHYQQLIDRGWRRSGHYLYKPDNSRTCCKQIPIRLKVDQYKASKHHRRALHNLFWRIHGTQQKPAKWKGKWGRQREWSPVSRWREIEWNDRDQPVKKYDKNDMGGFAERLGGPKSRRLETTLVPASSSEEKYKLYRKYQAKVHGETEDKTSGRKSWERFLVDTPMRLTSPITREALSETQAMRAEENPADLNSQSSIPWGTYHHEYRLDGQMFAVGVLDILPKCISSVYLFYDPDYDHLQVGKVAALREIALAKQLRSKRGMETLQYYYLGFYIETCQKMKYKAEYKPSQVLDCVSLQLKKGDASPVDRI